MIRAALLIASLFLAPPALAAERKVYVGSFDRIRVQGPFAVRVVQGSPGATVSGDPRAIDQVDLAVNGSTLTIRNAIGAWEERPRGTVARPVMITLTTRTISNAMVMGAGQLQLATMKAPRVDLSVTGAGTIEAAGIDADAANATIIGGGAITMTGKAARVRLLANGPATIDAGALVAGDLTVRVDGPGTVKANARFTAEVNNIGLGQVSVAGKPKCVVKSDVGGPVVCGGGG